MGADLIGLGYTRDESVPVDLDAVNDYISNLTDAQAWAIDGDEGGGNDGDTSRALIAEGAAILDHEGGRLGVTYTIGGGLYFVFVGDATWGDDPFEGFSAAAALLDADTPEAVAILQRLGIPGAGIVLPS